MDNYQNILEILECKSDEQFIKDAQRLIKNISSENPLIEKIKKEIKELTNTKLFRIKGLYNEEKIDKEKLEFIIKLINKDEEIYKTIEKIKKEKQRKDILESLRVLKENTLESKVKITNALESLFTSNNTKKISKIPLISNIQRLFFKKKHEEEINKKIEDLIKIIDETRLKKEDKNLKEQYYENLNQLLEQLETSCEQKNFLCIKKLKKEIKEQYNIIINKLSKAIQNNTEETKNAYDERLIEYVFNKKNNYVTYAIDHLSKNKDTLVYYAIIILKLITDIEKEQYMNYTSEIETQNNEESYINYKSKLKKNSRNPINFR